MSGHCPIMSRKQDTKLLVGPIKTRFFSLFCFISNLWESSKRVFFVGEEDLNEGFRRVLKALEGFFLQVKVDLVGWIASSTIKQEEQCLIQLGEELKGKGKGEMPHLLSPLLFLHKQALLLLLLVLHLLLVEFMLY